MTRIDSSAQVGNQMLLLPKRTFLQHGHTCGNDSARVHAMSCTAMRQEAGKIARQAGLWIINMLCTVLVHSFCALPHRFELFYHTTQENADVDPNHPIHRQFK